MSRQPENVDSPRAAQQGDAIAELSAVTGGLAHEIRNPLATLKVNLQLLAEDWRELSRLDPAASDLVRRSLNRVETMLREADRLAHILDAFLRYSARHEPRRIPCDLSQLVARIAEFVAPQAAAQGVNLECRDADGPLRVAVDDDLLEQALLNLVFNALQAMPDGGTLTIQTRRLPDGRPAIDVIDTGTGIPPDRVGRVFEPYYSTRRGGTGLGLPTARRIVAAHGGSIEVRSEPGQGSTFTIILPPDGPS